MEVPICHELRRLGRSDTRTSSRVEVCAAAPRQRLVSPRSPQDAGRRQRAFNCRVPRPVPKGSIEPGTVISNANRFASSRARPAGEMATSGSMLHSGADTKHGHQPSRARHPSGWQHVKMADADLGKAPSPRLDRYLQVRRTLIGLPSEMRTSDRRLQRNSHLSCTVSIHWRQAATLIR